MTTAAPPETSLLDEIEVPRAEVERWQVTADLLAEFAGVPAALIKKLNLASGA
jgi:hypothetical protein